MQDNPGLYYDTLQNSSGSLRMVYELGPKGREQVKSQGMVQDCEISTEQSKETALLPDTWRPSRDRKKASRGLDRRVFPPPDSEILGSKLSFHLSFSFCKVLLFTQRGGNVTTVGKSFSLKKESTIISCEGGMAAVCCLIGYNERN